MCRTWGCVTLEGMPIIDVRGLHKRYRDTVAVEEVSFSVTTGEIFGIVGPNGAGKTTTVECIEGLRVPDRGSVRVRGLDPQRDTAELRQCLGVQLQGSELPERLKVWEALDLYASFYRDPADLDELLDLLMLTEKRNTTFAKLSGGQKQRLSIALALVGNPEIAVFDELTTGVDPQARREVWDLIERVRAAGVTILLVTHLMEEAERLCDRVALIDRGEVVAIGTPAGLVDRTGDEHRVRFRPSAPVDLEELAELPEVTGVEQHGPQVVVTGTGTVLHAVIALLARRQIVAGELRVDQANLDDAFLALTNTNLD